MILTLVFCIVCSQKIEINCKTRNVVYCITCEKCKLHSWQTARSLDKRMREHIGYIRNLNINQIWVHFFICVHKKVFLVNIYLKFEKTKWRKKINRKLVKNNLRIEIKIMCVNDSHLCIMQKCRYLFLKMGGKLKEGF